MLRSLGLVALVVVALLFVGPARSLILPRSRDRTPPIDYTGYVRGFDDVASAPAVVPQALPSSWRANASDVDHSGTSAHLHIGWAVPGDGFAGLDEGTGDQLALLGRVTGTAGKEVRSATTIGGASWDVRRSSRGETVFTREVGGVFVIVTGDATDAQLLLLAASLH
jgi:hypothetical protein